MPPHIILRRLYLNLTRPRSTDVNRRAGLRPPTPNSYSCQSTYKLREQTIKVVGTGPSWSPSGASWNLKGYDPSTRQIVMVMHAGIDEAGITISPNEPISLNHHLIQSTLASAPPAESAMLPPMRTVRSCLVLHQKPPSEPDTTEYEISLPCRGVTLGIAIDLDDTTAIPFIQRIPKSRPQPRLFRSPQAVLG